MPVRNLLLCLEDQKPYLAPGASRTALAELIETLEDLDAPPLPPDFSAFLQQTNGFVWQGIEVFGTTGISIESCHGVVPSLPEVQDSYADQLAEMRGRLLIGRSEDDIYVYDEKTESYWILDRHGLEEVSSFPTFLDLMRQIVDEHQ